MTVVNYLECDHCGGPAVYATPDRFGKVLFHEGDADRCETCNIRGSIEINDDGDEEGPYAVWVASDVHQKERGKMTIRVKALEHRGAFRLFLKFSDGTRGEVNLERHLLGPVFEPLLFEKFFRQASVVDGAVVWPNGANFATEWLYALAHRLPEPVSNSGMIRVIS